MENKKPLIFMHIPKTGGVSLFPTLVENYEELLRIPPNLLSAYSHIIKEFRDLLEERRGVVSHSTFSHIYRIVGPENFSRYDVITLFRDPSEVMHSNYHYFKKQIYNSAGSPIKRGIYLKNSFKEFCECSTYFDCIPDNPLHCTKNIMTFMFYNYWKETKSKKDLFSFIIEDLLNTKFTCFGLTEEFEKSLLLFKKKLGWNYLKIQKYNVNKTKPKITKEEIKICKKYNSLDFVLYDKVKEIFYQKCEEEGIV